ncbi:ribonuclease H-like domain-containing protein [Tanacetum coccineum]
MDLESAQNNALAKLPLLKQGDYDTWRLRIESYIQLQDYALWEIIEDGNSFKPVARTTTNADGTSTSTIPGAVTVEEKIQKKNDLKAQSILMMTLLSEHLLTFNLYKDAKTLFEAIEARFGGNEATKETQKTLLKQITNDVNTSIVHVSTASSSLSTASTTDNTARLSDATIYAFLANQPNGSQVVHEDLEQIHEDDLEEMDLKWQLALLKCFNCHKMGHFVRECRNPRSQDYKSRNQDSSRKTMNVEESSSKSMLAIDGVGFDWSFMTEEKTPTNFALMAFSDSKSLDKLIGCQISDNNRKGVGYNVVPPPPIGLFAPPTIDLSNSGLEEFKQPEFEGYGVKVNKSVSENSSNEIKKTSGAPIIEDWISDCDEDETLEKVSESANVQKPKQADQPRKISQNPRNNNCDFHDNKMVQKPILNNVKKGTGQREVRPVWNNAMRTNHQNFSNSRRNFAPTAVLTKSGLAPISTARQSSSRAASSVSTVRPIKTVAPKTFVNVAKTRPNAFQKLHSPSRRPFYQQTALKNRNLNNKVNTVKVNSVNTAKGKRVTSVVGEQGINAVKSKACWVWRPKIKVLNHVFKNNGSYICLEFKVLVVYHTTNGHQFTMSNRQERIGYSRASWQSVVVPGGYTPECDEDRKKLNELTELCTKLSEKVTSLEQDLKQTKQVYGKALTKLVKKVKHLEDQLKSTTKRRKAKVVISDEEEDLVSEDPCKQGRMSKTKYGNTFKSYTRRRSTDSLPTEDMEKALWVELKRLFEPDKDDVLWKLQRYIYCQLQLWL